MNDPIYRCKSCGQLVNPERNKVCPACKCELFGNMTKDTSRHVKEKPVKYRKPLSFWKIVGIVALVWFLWNIVMPILLAAIALPIFSGAVKKETEKLTLESSKLTQTDVKDVTQNSLYPFETKKYFVYSDDINFNENIKKELMPLSYEKDKNVLCEFTLTKYENGDIWLRSGVHLFVPISKITLEGKEYQYLFMVDTIFMNMSLPNSIDSYNGEFFSFKKNQYFSKKKEMYQALTEKMLNAGEIDAILVSKEADDSISFQNFKFTYDFDDYKTIKTADGVVYETNDGKRYSSFIEIPHILRINQKQSVGITTLYSEVEMQ